MQEERAASACSSPEDTSPTAQTSQPPAALNGHALSVVTSFTPLQARRPMLPCMQMLDQRLTAIKQST